MSIALATRGYIAPSTSVTVVGSDPDPADVEVALIEVPVIPRTLEAVDHLALALSRLCEYAKGETNE
jgi:hypothetical protein